MPAERFYINQELEQGQQVFIEEEEFHHLVHVSRVKTKEVVTLVNGRGVLAEGLVENITKRQAAIQILSVQKGTPPPYELILAQGLPRQPRLEYLLEKTVELGVTKLWLFPGELSEKKDMSPSQMQRVNHILIAAMKQCGRLFLPELVLMPKILEWDKKKLPLSSFFGDTDPGAPVFLSILSKQKNSELLIAIGPEKGFNDKETAHMKDNLTIQGVHLHDNILRTDTAAIASVTLAAAFLQS